MKRSGISTLCGAIVLCTISTAAMAAADSGRGVGYAASGPMFDLPAGMSVSQQETHISLYAVRLIYVFNSATHQTVHFSFDLPEMPVDANPDVAALGKNSEAAGLAADVQPANYLNLSVRVNRQPLALAGHGRARFNGKDVTRQLLDAGVPLLAGPDGEPWRNLPPAMQTRLESSGLRNGDALWSYQASFEWDQSFEPGETRIELRYAPAFDDWADIAIDHFPEIAPGGSATRAYCIDDALRQAFFRKPFYDLYTVTHFSAPPSRSRGPVGHYRLVVDKGAVTNLVAFCPLTAKKTSPTTFEWTATNFTPGDEIGVLFFADPDAPSANEQEPP